MIIINFMVTVLIFVLMLFVVITVFICVGTFIGIKIRRNKSSYKMVLFSVLYAKYSKYRVKID